MNEIWLAGAVLAALLAIVRASLLPKTRTVAIPAALAALWVLISADDVSRRPLADVYAPLADRDALALVLMAFIAESAVAMRAVFRLVDAPLSRRAHGTTPRIASIGRQVLALMPMPSLLVGLRLLLAHAFQYVPASMGFGAYGMAIATLVFVTLSGAPLLVRAALPDRLWRIELYLLLRVLLIVGVVVGYAAVTTTPMPPPDASLSLRTLALVTSGLVTVAASGAAFDTTFRRFLRRSVRRHSGVP